MADFRKEVLAKETVVTIYFPSGKICCDLCPLMETYARKQCRGTGEYLLHTKDCTGHFCPLIEIDNDNMEELNNESI